MKKVKDSLLAVLMLFNVPLWPARQESLVHRPIEQAGTLSIAGAYKLANNISGPVTISGNNIVFDLNGYTITEGGSHGIIINNNAKHITVHNGTVGPITGGNGIDIAAGSEDITVHNLQVSACDIGLYALNIQSLTVDNNLFLNNTNEGIKLESCSKSIVSQSKLYRNDIGVTLDQSNDIIVENCSAVANTSIGFSVTTCTGTVHINCKSLLTGTGNAGNSYGFASQNGSRNAFISCISQGTTTTATAVTNLAAGFLLAGTETKSNISSCVASGTNTPAANSSRAYGIFMQETYTTPTQMVSGDRGGEVFSGVWSLIGDEIIATGALASSGEVTAYTFDVTPSTSTLTTADEVSHGATVNEVSMAPNTRQIAVVGAAGSGGYDIRVFYTDNQRLSFGPNQTHGATLNSISWAKDSTFLAVGGLANAGSEEISLYEFNQYMGTLDLRDAVVHGATVESIAFCPTHFFLAVGGAVVTGNELHIYELSPTSKTLVLRDSVAHGATVNSVAWSSDGKYLAIGGEAGTGGYDTRVYEFDSTAKTLTLRDSATHGASVKSVHWNPGDGYLATGGATATTDEVRIYSFSRDTKTLTLQDSLSHGAVVNAVSWSPNGLYLLIGGALASGATHRIYKVFDSPSDCIILDNRVNDTTGNTHNSSSGISAPLLTNYIFSNLCYKNDRDYRFVNLVSSPDLNPDFFFFRTVNVAGP